MCRVLCHFVLCGLFLAPVSWARAQDEEPAPQEPPAAVEADPVPDSRVHLVREPGGHAAVPRALLFTPDGKKLVSTGDDLTVQVWDVQTKERLRVIRPPAGLDGLGSVPEHLVVDRRGERIAFQVEARHAADDTPGPRPGRPRERAAAPGQGKHGPARKVRTTFVCSLETGQAQALKRGGPLDFTPDGKSLAVGEGSEVRLVEIDTDRVLQTATFKHPVLSLAFSPDGKTLAVVNGEAKVHLFDAATLRPRDEPTTSRPKGKRPAAGGEHNLRSVSWADDKTLVCRSAQKDKELIVLDAATGEPKRSYGQKELVTHLPRGTNATLLELRAIPGTRKVLVLMANRRAGEGDDWANVSFLFDWAAREASKSYLIRSPYGCAATAVAPDLTLAAQGDGNLNDVVLWDPTEGKEVSRLRAAVRGADGRQTSIRWRPDGKAIAWGNLEDRSSRGWAELDLTTLVLRARKEEELATYQRGIVREWGEVRLSAKNGHLELTGVPPHAMARFGAAVDWDYTFVAGGRVATDTWNSPVLQVLDSTGKKLYATRVVHSFIQALAVSPRPECRYVLIGSADQTLTVYNPATGKVLLTVFPTGADWIAWTPEGYYAGTPGGEKLMGWQVENGPDRLASFYPAERFRKVFYRPDVVKLVLEKGSVKDALEAANAARKNEGEKVAEGPADLEQLLPPQAALEILDKAALPKVKLKATAEAAAKGQPVTSLQLRVDGRPLPDGQAVLELKAAQDKAEATWEVELPPGEHELKVLARSPDTAGASSAVSLDVPVPSAAAERPTLHLIAVGINAYPQKALQLGCAVADAQGLAETFGKHCAGPGNLFDKVNPTTLLDGQAKRDAILGALKGVRQAVKPGDLLVFSFAGHGAKQGKKFYLLTYDADPTKLADTALSGDDLRAALADLPCQVLLLLDACHSAACVRAFTPATDDAARDMTDDECGVAVLCAAMGYEEAQEDKGHGLFTKAVIEALTQGEGVPFNRHDRRQYVHHLGAFVQDEVQHASKDEQHPFLTLPYVTESFPLRLLTGRSPGGR